MEKEKLFCNFLLTLSLNGDLHKGSFEKDLEHGKGFKTYYNHQSLSSYEGDWLRGSMNGTGKLIMYDKLLLGGMMTFMKAC